jgi:uncharacterized protein YybS (DUF2232 family)
MITPRRELALDAIKGGVLTLALFLAYVTFPVIGLLPGLFVPLPAAYFHFKKGAAAGAGVFAITLTVLILMQDGSSPLLYTLQSGLIGFLLPFFYLRGKGAAKSVAYSVGIDFLLIIVLAIVYGFWSGVDLQAMLLKGIETSSEQAIGIYSKQEGLSPDDLAMLTSGIRQVGQLIANVFPALLLVSLGSLAAINLSVLFRFAAKTLPQLPRPESYLAFKNPEALVWILIAAGFSMLIPQPDLKRVALNILVVFGFIYFLQGLAVVLSFFQRVSLPTLARIIFWLVLAFQPYLVLAIAFLGVFDIWGDFRAPKQKNL